MSYLNPTTRARIIARINTLEDFLDLLETSYTSLIQQTAKRYRFDSGEGSQMTENRDLSEVKAQMDSIESELDQLYRRLQGNGLTAIKVRRKHGGMYPYGRNW